MATAVSEAVKTHQLYINGEWRDATGGETFPSINPSNEEVIANVPKGHPGGRPGGHRGRP